MVQNRGSKAKNNHSGAAIGIIYANCILDFRTINYRDHGHFLKTETVSNINTKFVQSVNMEQ